MTLTSILALVGGFVVVAGVLVVAFLYLRGSADKVTVEAQGRLLETRGQEIADLQRRLARVEAENEQLKLSVANVRGIDKLRDEVAEVKSDTTAIRQKVGA